MKLLVLLVVCGLIETASAAERPDWHRHLAGLNATFVLLNGSTGEYTRHDPARAARRFSPCSTFEIPNSAIALETGVASEAAFTLSHAPTLEQGGAEARDHELARRIGAEREQRYVKQFGYGNQDASGPLDSFWIGGSLRISADEQAAFLQRLHDSKLGLSPRTTAIVKHIMLADSGPGWRLSAQTGACGDPGQPDTLWYAGYVEKGPVTHYFALELGTPDFNTLKNERGPITRAILDDLGLTTPSAGEAMLKRSCTVCHNLDAIRERHLSREDWGLELGKMTSMGAKIQNRAALLNYLVKVYGK